MKLMRLANSGPSKPDPMYPFYPTWHNKLKDSDIKDFKDLQNFIDKNKFQIDNLFKWLGLNIKSDDLYKSELLDIKGYMKGDLRKAIEYFEFENRVLSELTSFIDRLNLNYDKIELTHELPGTVSGSIGISIKFKDRAKYQAAVDKLNNIPEFNYFNRGSAPDPRVSSGRLARIYANWHETHLIFDTGDNKTLEIFASILGYELKSFKSHYSS